MMGSMHGGSMYGGDDVWCMVGVMHGGYDI